MKLCFQEIARQSAVTQQRMIAVCLIMIVGTFPFLIPVGTKKCGIKIKKA